MSRLLFSLLFFIAVSSFFCKSKELSSTQRTDIARSYKIIYQAFSTTKQVQENFFQEATKSLGVIQYDKDASVDTKKLKLLLDSANAASEARIYTLSQADEIDDEIMYKSKALKYVRLLDSLYNNEFVRFIDILNSKTEKRFERCQELLLKRLQDMKSLMDESHEAGVEVRKKYNIQLPDQN